MQEILILVVIALAIFCLPRVMRKKPAPAPEIRRPSLTGWMRLAILVTVFWIAGSAALLKPWQEEALRFACVGLGPAVALWGAVWVWFGYKKYRR